MGEGGEKKSRSKSAGQAAEGPWATRKGHAGSRQGSLAAHRTMTAVVFSLEGEGGTEFSPSRFLSDPSSSCWGKKHTHTHTEEENQFSGGKGWDRVSSVWKSGKGKKEGRKR